MTFFSTLLYIIDVGILKIKKQEAEPTERHFHDVP